MNLNDKIDLFGFKLSKATLLVIVFILLAVFTVVVNLTDDSKSSNNKDGQSELSDDDKDSNLKDDAEKWLDSLSSDNYTDGEKKPTRDKDSKGEEETFYKISEPMPNPYAELDKLTGLGSVKAEVRSMVNYIKVQEARKKQGLATKDVAYHMVFTGNPGTGKTTVARIMAGIFKDLGVLKRGHTVETDRSGLVGEYVGQTGPKTNKAINAALGGVLFIDEAYALMQEGNNNYGNEAIATLLKRMEDDRDNLVVIIAGYTNEMNHLVESNPGLKSRFNRYIEFPDYSADDLCTIFTNFAKSGGYTLDAQARNLLAERMRSAVAHKNRHFGNGRYARNVFERAIIIQADRLEKEGGADHVSTQALQTLTASDLEAAFNKVKN